MGLASKKKICCNKKGKIFVEKWVYVNDNKSGFDMSMN